MTLKEKIIGIIQQANDFLSKEYPIGSQDFIKLANSLINLSDLASNLENRDQEERKDIDFEWIWKQNIIQNSVVQLNFQPQEVILPPQLIKTNSVLIDVEKHWGLFKTWFDGLDFDLTLLYRGSEQEFSDANFIRIVGNRGPTLHIVKSEHDYLFGGVAFNKYPILGIKEDAKAFLFQLHPNQVQIKNRQDSF